MTDSPSYQEATKAARADSAFLAYAREWCALEESGMNHMGRRAPYHPTILPLIASGQLDSRVAIQYCGNNTFLQGCAEFSTEDQGKLLDLSIKYPVLVKTTDGEKVESKTIAQMLPAERSQVFVAGRIRAAAEQKPYIPPAPKAAPKTEPAKSDCDVWGALSAKQRQQLAAAATRRKTTVAALVIDLLVMEGEVSV